MTTSLTEKRAFVKSVRRVGKSARGAAIFELATDIGTFRTAANSLAGFALSSSKPDWPGMRMKLMINSRGTVSGVSRC